MTPKIILVIGILMIGCHGGGKHEHSGTANEYMNQSSFESLVRNFESEERTAYQKPDEVLKYMGDITGQTVADLGAGSGYFSVRLAKQGAHVIAADVDDRFLEYIKNRLPNEKLDSTQVELRKIPFDDSGLKQGEVDKVLIVDVYHHIEDRVVYFTKLKSALKPGGTLFVVDYFKRELPAGPPVDHKIGEDVVTKELTEAGFKILEVNTTLLPYQYIIKAE